MAMVWTILLLFAANSAVFSAYPLRFASYYGDHMVLQAAPQRSNVWGYADLKDEGKTVTLTLKPEQGNSTTRVQKGVVKRGVFTDKAVWVITLDPVSHEDGAFTLTVSLDNQTSHINDVLFGDVWVCSGQSNMGFTVLQMFNATQELNAAKNYPKIRIFSALTQYSKDQPLYDLKAIALHWSLPSKENLGHGNFSWFSAVCWLYGRNLYDALKKPMGLVESAWGGTPIEAWSTPEGLKACGRTLHAPLCAVLGDDGLYRDTNRLRPECANSALWNAMIHPLLNMTIYGVVWYQGEQNTGDPDSYYCTFPQMITDWRRGFNRGSGGATSQVMPFGFVQLSTTNEKGPKGYTDIRWHQTVDYGYVPNFKMPNTFMAVAMDLVDAASPWGAVHPRTKEPVGWRLAQAGMGVAYGKNVTYQGPYPTKFIVDVAGKTVQIYYDNSATNLEIRSKNGFEICCKDGCQMSGSAGWVATPIVKYDNHSVTLAWDVTQCQEVWTRGLRYVWRNTPCPYMQCAVYDRDSKLPAAPFYSNGIY